MQTIDWDNYCTRWMKARGSKRYATADLSLKTVLKQSRFEFSLEDIKWLDGALQDQSQKWFVARVFNLIQPIPETLFASFMRAAVYEVDVSSNRQFVEPCTTSFGYERVNVALMDFFKHGMDIEKAGAVNALYWAQPLVPSDQLEQKMRERRKNPDWLEQQRLFLQEFVTNSEVWLRRSLIGKLELNDLEIYPEHVKPLVDQAIRIARSHSDDYIRQRVEIQLGSKRFPSHLQQED